MTKEVQRTTLFMKNKIGLALLSAPLLFGCSQSELPINDSNYSTHQKQQVIIVHGLARSASSMEKMSDRVSSSGYQVCVVDYSTLGRAVDTTLHESSAQIDQCIDKFNRELSQTKGSKVHFVGHSLGGLVIRNYLAQNNSMTHSPHFGEVVFVGTPNKGSDVADFFSNLWLLPLAGGTAASLTTSSESLPNSLPEPNYAFGVIAGTDSYPILKYMFDNSNDGLVSVESTQLEGMQDFIAVNITHDSLRSDPLVTDLIVNYLDQRRFASQ
ncbi:alpha/beta fold hydrolase [Vibrio ezurae]|uniref:AB hydrolase-1 domain-containing protein n=1 Tax=Vibrio ezurae NBRC 102218 TaxID=1219080 RepID=U3AHE6_9VIBR|nr:alpha/beta fold hydrolase [Vibrio ezurae]GAD79321.1 hypothetical protein VEZ01S_09_00900 [Vibrio ezurae NBRC 102218]